MNLSQITSPKTWNTLIAALPHSHILQSWEWGDFKSRYGWQAQRWVWNEGQAAAQVLTREVFDGLRVMYVPKGPLLDWGNDSLRAQVLDDLQALAQHERAILIKIDPDIALPAPPVPPIALQSARGETTEMRDGGDIGGVTSDLRLRTWRLSSDQIQFRNTVILDLRPSEAQLLERMKQKTRYNIRLAEKKGVRVRSGLGSPADLDLLYRMYAETSVRDGFVIRSKDYYRDAWSTFIQAGLARPFIAEVEGQAVSALVLFIFARTAWYMYGMSREAHREKMPNHLLQWEAMRWAKAQGCERYDFWGAPDEFDSSDPMWGVWKFKEGFGGQVVRHIGAWDYPASPLLYRLYTVVLPRVLSLMRWRGKRQTRAAVD